MSKYIIATFQSKDHFTRLQRKPNHGGEGIDYYLGFRADGSSAVESILFNTEQFSRADIDRWLAENHSDKTCIVEAADLKGLSFNQIKCLVQEAINEEYPPVVPVGGSMMPSDECCRYEITQIWDNQALACSTYWSDPEDPCYMLFPYTIAEPDADGDLGATLGDPIPMKLQAVAVDNPKLALDIEMESGVDLANITEAGKRNSSKDSKALNQILKLTASLLSSSEMDPETMKAMKQMVGAPMESEASAASWDGSKSRFSIDQLINAVPAAIASWARAQAKAGKRNVIKSDLHLPYKEPDGTVNLAGVRNALSRLPQVKGVPAEVLAKAKAELQKALKNNSKESLEPREGEDPGILESWNGMGGETFVENFNAIIGESSQFDEGKMVVKGVSVLGPVSKNQRRYSREVQEAALPLFEGAKAYLNHPSSKELGEARRVQDLIGEHKNVRMSGDMTYSDLHLIDNATVREHVVPIIKQKPHLAGNSIVVRGESKRAKDGWEDVTKILAVRSIDVVAEPATTNGIYESEQQMQTPSEDTMELKDLTIEELRTKRPDLFEAAVETTKEKKEQEDKLAKLEAQLTNLQKDVAERDAKLAAIEEEKKTIAKKGMIESLIATSKIPDTAKYETKDGSKIVRESFRAALDKCADENGMKELIGIWESSFASVPAKPAPASTIFSPEKVIGEAGLGGNGLAKFDSLFN